ncbi:probable catalytic subunit of DNA polymerase zeta UPR-1 [Cephalotrichum gorgonifer]|uniref:DNA polymerase n=1 Tax=Cephalotrichum gorgonifer TaxID=2041049 RepID=A0AAE8STF6_9PEZI|nr:probable catalytic subunit of DNA polymerase zeta UPR-1 [Cephalotrichum gorgonifer]
MDPFRVRLNCIDHYQAAPTRYDPQLRNDVRPSQARRGTRVPVVRVFGSTETGQKVCVHVHGAFPYLFVPYNGSLAQDAVGTYMYRLHMSIDYALAVSYRRDQSGENAKFVARITLVKGVPFYGYHVGYRYFLKIYLFNPVVVSRLAGLLQQGVIMKQKFQPYETHLQYQLQFMCDYNLYGCDYLEAGKAYFRAPVPAHEAEGDAGHRWDEETIPGGNITDGAPDLPRLSHCALEVDICVQDIRNRKAVRERRLHHDFTEMVKPPPADAKLVHSMAGLWKDETRRRRLKKPGGSRGSASPFPADALVSMSADPRESQAPVWVHDEEYRELVAELIEQEKTDGEAPKFEGFVGVDPDGESVRTVLQSVADLYPENLRATLGLVESASQAVEDPSSSIDVDAKGILPALPNDDDYFPDDSEEEFLLELAMAEEEALVGESAERADAGETSAASTGEVLLDIDPSILGVCASGLVTGRRPEIPLTEEFLEAAREEQFISRKSTVPTSSATSQPVLKRSSTPEPAGLPSKRPRLEEERPKSAKPATAPGAHQLSSAPAPRSAPKKRPGRSPASSQSKEQSNQMLNFTVVKDPSSSFHLSQSGQKSAQRHADGGGSGEAEVCLPAAPPTPSSSSKVKQVRFGADDDGSSSRNTTTPLRSGSLTLLSGSQDSSVRLAGSVTNQRPVLPASSRWTTVVPTEPPSASEVCSSMKGLGIPDVVYQDAFYSDEKDVPPRPAEFAGREFRLESNTLPFLPEFNPTGAAGIPNGVRDPQDTKGLTDAQRRRICTFRSWEIGAPPPTYDDVAGWWAEKVKRRKQRDEAAGRLGGPRLPSSQTRNDMSQIEGPTLANKQGFKYSQKRKVTGVVHETQYMSTLSVEVHVNTRGKLVPNPEEDEVQCIFWCVKSDDIDEDDSSAFESGIVVLSEDGLLAEKIRKQSSTEVLEETSELDLFVRMVEIVRNHDPDILTGYEVHGGSWGYLIERARLKYDYDLCDEFSRMKSSSHGRFGKEADRWGFNTTSTIRVTGRHMINVWRAMRGELNLLQYTLENVAWHLLHRRVPHYPWKVLTAWYKSGRPRDLAKLLRHYHARTKMNIEILDANEIIPRTSEQARLLGVDFFSVFSRGSQFKVESIMFRIAKPESYLLVSPSKKQVGSQNALECLPLVMEPQSAFYTSPVLVLDFQSLYPSVMIAYNYCYSTFLGRIANWRGANKMGFTEYERQERLLELLKDHINIAPNGMMYVKSEVRKSLLAKMLTEILETRVMVKSGMKQDKEDRRLQRLLNNRQLALKLLANVTYGYTSASFSGRMPCAEIADSIVQTGRETLERAVAYIHSREDWGAEVVYGDTDSIFVHLKGRTKDQAFDIGAEMAKAVTEMNPRPVKLKFEKVYLPCVLLAKKRYVGYKYESRDQAVPEFDAKGIETVRRDGTPAEQKMEEKALRILFETADLSAVKRYFQAQCDKIMRGAVSVQDFCFAKEDPRAEPQYGERVPYVVVAGAPGDRLADRCVAPEELLRSPHASLDAEYYISKNLVPPLDRIFNLVGASCRTWYDEMPRVRRVRRLDPAAAAARKTLESYLSSASCAVCGAPNAVGLCASCEGSPASLVAVRRRLAALEKGVLDVDAVCRSCAGLAPLEEVRCDSRDCPVYYTRVKEGVRLRGERAALAPVLERLEAASLEW